MGKVIELNKIKLLLLILLPILFVGFGAISYTHIIVGAQPDNDKYNMLKKIIQPNNKRDSMDECIIAALHTSRDGKIAFQYYYNSVVEQKQDRWLYELILIGQTAALFDADIPAFYQETRAQYLQAAETATGVQSQMAFYAYTQNDRVLAKKILEELPYYRDFHPYKSNLANQLLRKAATNDDIIFVVYAINNSAPDFWQRIGLVIFYGPMLFFILIKKYFGWLVSAAIIGLIIEVIFCAKKHITSKRKSKTPDDLQKKTTRCISIVGLIRSLIFWKAKK